MTKQYEITVKILVTIPDADSQSQYDEAMIIARYYADMALKYKSVGADEVVEVTAKEAEHV
jgi:hypothetical protein